MKRRKLSHRQTLRKMNKGMTSRKVNIRPTVMRGGFRL